MALPTAEELFDTFFAPWHPPEEHEDGNVWLRPDFEEIELPPGAHIRVLDRLTPEGRAAAGARVAGMERAAREDWPALLGVSGEPGPAWLEAFDRWATEERVAELLKTARPEQSANPILVLACEAGALTGGLLLRAHPGMQWLVDWPYWNSAVFDLNTRTRLHVFAWAVRRFAAGGAETPLLARYETALKLLRGGPPDPAL